MSQLETKKFSIIMPSFNQVAFIKNAIKSVQNQTYSNWELIVQDNFSCSTIRDYLTSLKDTRIIVFIEKDTGQSNAINKGILRASGDYIGWLNSDDLLENNCLKNVSKTFDSYKEIDFVYGHGATIDRTGKLLNLILVNNYKLSDLLLFSKNLWVQPGTFWTKSIISRVGYLREDLHYTMDVDYWIRMARSGKMKSTGSINGYLRIYEQTKTGSNPEGFCKEFEGIFEANGHEIDKKSVYYYRWLYYRRIKMLLKISNYKILISFFYKKLTKKVIG